MQNLALKNRKLIRYGGEEFFQAEVPTKVWTRGRLVPAKLRTLTKLAPESRLGTRIGETADSFASRVVTWWKSAKEKLREAIVAALRHPLSALVAGIGMVMLPTWGAMIAALYLGIRAGLFISWRGNQMIVDPVEKRTTKWKQTKYVPKGGEQK